MDYQMVAENWVNQKTNRKRQHSVEWVYGTMYCNDGHTIYSYGGHYPIAYRTGSYFGKRPVFTFNTVSGYDYGKSSCTDNHLWYVRKAIEKVNGLIVEINDRNADKVLLHGVDREYNFLDLNWKGEALIDISRMGVVLITEIAMILIEQECETIAEAKKSLIPKGLGKDYVKWKNYFFKPTELDDKSFASKKKLTLKNMRAWTRQGWVDKPKEISTWYEIKSRIFGNNPIASAFGFENPAPYIFGTVYSNSIHRDWGSKKIFNTEGKWWKVFPMNCAAYTEKDH